MAPRGRRRSAARLLAGLLVALATLVASSGVAGATDGLVVDASTTYTLDVESTVVRTEFRARLTNTIPPRTRGDVIETAFFERLVLPVVGPVANVTALGPDGPLSTSVSASGDGVRRLTINLSPRLLHGEPQDVVVRYDLPAQEPRSAEITRVNQAYAAWYVATHGDPGAARLRIELPPDFEVAITTTPADLRTGPTDDGLVVTNDGTEDPEQLFFAISVLREEALVESTVEVDGATVTIRSWPGDEQWRAFATDRVERGIPVLTELVGRPLPDTTLRVLETSGGAHLGYGGFFSPDGTIEVGDALDSETLLHELGHAWINTGLFPERWLIEGITQEVARRAALRLDVEPGAVPGPDDDAEVAGPLNQWGHVGLTDQGRAAREAWGYGASYHVANELVGGFEDARLADVLTAASERLIAYRGAPAPERLVVDEGWRYMLDLLEEAGVTRAPDLYRTHVVTAAQAAELDARAGARAAYAALLQRSGSWSAPFPLRRAMGLWDFEAVSPLVATADRLQLRAAQVEARLAEAGSSLPEIVQTTYEATENLDEVEGLLTTLEGLAARLADLDRRRDRVDALQRVGLLGSNDSLLAMAGDAAAAGDLATAKELVDRETARLDDAARTGALRIGLVGGTLVLLLAGSVVLRRRRRGGPGDAGRSERPGRPGRPEHEGAGSPFDSGDA